jgi:hypothetical protein
MPKIYRNKSLQILLSTIAATLLLAAGIGLQSSAGQSVTQTKKLLPPTQRLQPVTKPLFSTTTRQFVPTETVSSDKAVSFPVDI